MKEKKLTRQITVNREAEALALLVMILGMLYSGDRKRVIRAINAYYERDLA